MIEISELSYRYPGRRKRPARQALDNVSLRLKPGQLFVLTGPNGGGKSTLFRVLCGLALPSAGSVHIKEIDILREPERARSLTGIVFQSAALDKHLTVMENFRIHRDLYRMSASDFSTRLEEGLSWTALEGRLSDKVSQLSGGLQRQVELVKALLHRPEVLLMDEPTAGLDPGGRHRFLEATARARQETGLTIFMTSHLFSEAERADQVGILQNGRLLALDAPSNLKAALGREMLVVESSDLDAIEAHFQGEEALDLQRLSEELRIKGGDPVAIMADLLACHRESIQSLSLRQPTLLDVYIHHTGRDPGEEEAGSKEAA